MNARPLLSLATAAALTGPATAGEPPLVNHQPSACTVAQRPLSLCARISDDGQVARARVYFRPTGDKHYVFVEMSFDGINYCGTLPAPKRKKLKVIEYYVQAIDDEYQTQRVSTYQIPVQDETACAFPPVETDAARAASIVVHGTHKKQKKLSGRFVSDGVKFVPLASR